MSVAPIRLEHGWHGFEVISQTPDLVTRLEKRPGWLRRFLVVWPAALISAAFFGLIHGLVPIIFAAAAVGLVLAIAYEKTGSLWSPVIIHATQNSVAIAIMFASLA